APAERRLRGLEHRPASREHLRGELRGQLPRIGTMRPELTRDEAKPVAHGPRGQPPPQGRRDRLAAIGLTDRGGPPTHTPSSHGRRAERSGALSALAFACADLAALPPSLPLQRARSALAA